MKCFIHLMNKRSLHPSFSALRAKVLDLFIIWMSMEMSVLGARHAGQSPPLVVELTVDQGHPNWDTHSREDDSATVAIRPGGRECTLLG